jgi:hypothetical protein
MKLYETKSHVVTQLEDSDEYETVHYREYTSSAGDASKARTRLKKLEHESITTTEVEIDTSRAGIIKFLNERSAHATWVVDPTAAALG